jgi:glycerol-3-phosphate acyltransferase PlsX
MLASSLRSEFKRNWLTKMAALVAISVLNNFKKRFDHRRTTGPFCLGSRASPSRAMVRRTCWLLATRSRAYDAAENRVVERIAGRIAEMASAPTLAVEEMSECMHV